MENLFVDKNINVKHGEAAKKLIANQNDSMYIENNAIIKVDKSRWLDAQHYERKTWMEIGTDFTDDRNYEHYQRFDSYNSLKNHPDLTNVKNIIELGSGPFTNIRTFMDIIPNLSRLDLLDPLIDDYLNHPNCTYKNRKINNREVITHNCPIEQFGNEIKYDLVIMNNVLEHCYDIEIIFDKILNMISDNGFFIFSDVYFEEEDVEKMVYQIYDAGHPLKLTRSYMSNFLSNFNTIYDVDFHGLYGQEWRHDKYFIGSKKTNVK